MSLRRNRLIPSIAFIALVANMFAPVLTLPVTAAINPLASEPILLQADTDGDDTSGDLNDTDLTGNDADGDVGSDSEGADSPDPGTDGNQGGDAEGADPPEPVTDGTDDGAVGDDTGAISVIAVSPTDPTFDATCADSALFHGVVPAITDGITYQLTGPDDAGSYLLTASLVSGDYAWADAFPGTWVLNTETGVATYSGTSAPACEAPEVVDETETDEPVVDEPVLVAPELPTLADATCGDEGVLFTQTVTAATTPEGVAYDVVTGDDGVVSVTASLTGDVEWDTANIGTDWQPSEDGLTYVHTLTLMPCESSAEPQVGALNFEDLSIQVNPVNGTVASRGDIAFEITLANNGLTDTISGITVTNTLPQGLAEYNWSTGVSGCSFDALVMTCTDLSVPADDALPILITGKADFSKQASACPKSFTTRATFTYGGQTSSEAQATVNMTCAPLLTMTLIPHQSAVHPGDTFQYTTTVTNIGTAPSGEYAFLVEMPSVVPQLTVFSLPSAEEMVLNCIAGNWGFIDFSCKQPTLGPGESRITVWTTSASGQPPAEACDTYLEITYGGGQAEGQTLWRQGSVFPSPYTNVFLNCTSPTITKTALTPVVGPYDDIVFEITVTNSSDLNVAGVEIIDVLPDGLDEYTWSAVTENNEDCNFAPQLLLWCPAVTVQGNNDHTVTVTGVADTSLPASECGEYTNSAYYYLPADDPNDDIEHPEVFATVTLECLPLLTLSKVADKDTDEPGGIITYTITVTNIGTATEDEYTFLDDLPSGVTLVDDPIDVRCPFADPSSSYYDCKGVDLPAGESHLFTFSVMVKPDVSQDICDSLLINHAGGSDNVVEPYADGRWADGYGFFENQRPIFAVTELNCITTHEFTKTAVDDEVVAGDHIHFLLTLQNTGNVVISEATITDVLPPLPGDFEWTITPSLGIACYPVAPDGTLTCELNEHLYSDGVVTVDVAVELPSDLGELAPEWCVTWENLASVVGYYYVDSEPSEGPQFVASNEIPDERILFENSSGDSVFVNCTDLVIEKTVSSALIEPGEDVVYTVTVTNTGLSTVMPVLIYDPLSEVETVFSDWSISGNLGPEFCLVDTNPNPGTEPEYEFQYGVACIYLELPAGESVSVTITGTAPELPTWEQCEPVTNRAAFLYVQAGPRTDLLQPSSTVPEPGELIFSNVVTTQVNCDPEIEIEKTGVLQPGDDDLMQSGEIIAYTFKVTNTGNVELQDIELDDEIEGVTFTNGSTIESLAVGESVTLTATYAVTQPDINNGILVNCVDVSAMGPGEESVSDDDCDTQVLDQDIAIVIIQACPGPADDFAPEVGQQVTYEMTIMNPGTVTVHNVEVTTSREGTFNQPFPTTLGPGESVTREWTIVATQEDYDAREIVIEVTVTGETEAGDSMALASMVAMQAVGDTVENTLMLTCPMAELPDPTPSPTPEKTSAAVSKLPDTGSGSFSTAALLWSAAMVSTILLGASALGIRRKSVR